MYMLCEGLVRLTFSQLASTSAVNKPALFCIFSFSALERPVKPVASLELEEEFAIRLDSPDVPLEISETREAREGVVSYPAAAGKCRK